MKLKALYALLLCLPALGQAAERNDILAGFRSVASA